MPNCGAVAVLLIQVHHKIKIICDKESSISLQNEKKPSEECSLLRSYRVVGCNFSKKDSFKGVFSRFAIKLVVPYGKTFL